MSNEIKVESNIPVPIGRGARKAYEDYPLREMKAGDSFLKPDNIHYEAFRARIKQFTYDNPGYEFIVRKMPDGTGYRCFCLRGTRT